MTSMPDDARRRRPTTPRPPRRSAAVLVPVLVVVVVVGFVVVVLATREPAANRVVDSPLVGRAGAAARRHDARRRHVRPGRPSAGGSSLVNFFATWCVPCQREHDDLAALRRAPPPHRRRRRRRASCSTTRPTTPATSSRRTAATGRSSSATTATSPSTTAWPGARVVPRRPRRHGRGQDHRRRHRGGPRRAPRRASRAACADDAPAVVGGAGASSPSSPSPSAPSTTARPRTEDRVQAHRRRRSAARSAAASRPPTATRRRPRPCATEIAERVEAGETDDEIRAYFASRYGDEILLTPAGRRASAALVWVAARRRRRARRRRLACAFVRGGVVRWRRRPSSDRDREFLRALARRPRARARRRRPRRRRLRRPQGRLRAPAARRARPRRAAAAGRRRGAACAGRPVAFVRRRRRGRRRARRPRRPARRDGRSPASSPSGDAPERGVGADDDAARGPRPLPRRSTPARRSTASRRTPTPNPDDPDGFDAVRPVRHPAPASQSESAELLDAGEAFLDRALELDPTYVEARVLPGAVVLDRTGPDRRGRAPSCAAPRPTRRRPAPISAASSRSCRDGARTLRATTTGP